MQVDLPLLIKRQLGVLMTCNLIIEDLEVLYDKQAEETREAFPYFERVMDYKWKILILELNKLFNPREKGHKFEKTINLLINNQKSIHKDSFVKHKDLKSLLANLEKEETKNTIEALETIRDKFVAHLDTNHAQVDVTVSFDQIKQLYQIGFNIADSLHVAITGNQFIFSNLTGMVNSVLEALKEK